MRRLVVLLALAACRFHFDPIGASGDGGGGSDSTDSTAGKNILFVQQGDFDSNTSFATINVTLQQPQQAGNLNIAVVAWGSTGDGVSSVSDSAGNSYSLAIGPTINTCDAQSIYFASNIVASTSNTVTVTYNATVTFPTLLVLEYSGPTSLDTAAEGAGSTINAASATLDTTSAPELVFGAGVPDNCSPPDFASAGTGFTQRTITNIAGMLGEDIITSQLGTFGATGQLTATSPWVMQTVAFK